MCNLTRLYGSHHLIIMVLAVLSDLIQCITLGVRPFHLSIYKSIYPHTHQPTHPSIHQSTNPHTHPSIYTTLVLTLSVRITHCQVEITFVICLSMPSLLCSVQLFEYCLPLMESKHGQIGDPFVTLFLHKFHTFTYILMSHPDNLQNIIYSLTTN